MTRAQRQHPATPAATATRKRSGRASTAAARQPRADGDATRNQILQVAGQLFARQGYDATTSKQICDAAGVNLASVNYHFGSREGLYAAVLVEAHRQLITLQTLGAIAGTRADGRTKLAMLMDTLVLAHREHQWQLPLVFRAMMMPSPALDPVIEQEIIPKRLLLQQVIAEAAGLPPDDPRLPYCVLSIMGPWLMLLVANRQNMGRILKNFWDDPDALAAHLKGWAFAGLDQLRTSGTQPAGR